LTGTETILWLNEITEAGVVMDASQRTTIMATSGCTDYPEDFHERFLNYLLASEKPKELCND
jgi:hypothetical protein